MQTLWSETELEGNTRLVIIAGGGEDSAGRVQFLFFAVVCFGDEFDVTVIRFCESFCNDLKKSIGIDRVETMVCFLLPVRELT